MSEEKSYCLPYLNDAAPEILWYDVQDVGSYSGSVYAIGLLKTPGVKERIVVFKGYYGSCSGCGAWGEGGEPKDMKEVMEFSKCFETVDAAIENYKNAETYSDTPDFERGLKALERIREDLKS